MTRSSLSPGNRELHLSPFGTTARLDGRGSPGRFTVWRPDRIRTIMDGAAVVKVGPSCAFPLFGPREVAGSEVPFQPRGAARARGHSRGKRAERAVPSPLQLMIRTRNSSSGGHGRTGIEVRGAGVLADLVRTVRPARSVRDARAAVSDRVPRSRREVHGTGGADRGRVCPRRRGVLEDGHGNRNPAGSIGVGGRGEVRRWRGVLTCFVAFAASPLAPRARFGIAPSAYVGGRWHVSRLRLRGKSSPSRNRGTAGRPTVRHPSRSGRPRTTGRPPAPPRIRPGRHAERGRWREPGPRGRHPAFRVREKADLRSVGCQARGRSAAVPGTRAPDGCGEHAAARRRPGHRGRSIRTSILMSLDGPRIVEPQHTAELARLVRGARPIHASHGAAQSARRTARRRTRLEPTHAPHPSCNCPRGWR